MGEVEKNHFIALPDEGDHSRLLPSKLYPALERASEEFLCLFVWFCLFRAALGHMEVPSLGVKLELWLPAYAIATAMPDP